MNRVVVDPEYVEQLARRTENGLKEAIRREVERRQRLGLPIVVQRNGQIIDLQTGQPPEPLAKPNASLNTEFDDQPTT